VATELKTITLNVDSKHVQELWNSLFIRKVCGYTTDPASLFTYAILKAIENGETEVTLVPKKHENI
jgi:hypothetical protein